MAGVFSDHLQKKPSNPYGWFGSSDSGRRSSWCSPASRELLEEGWIKSPPRQGYTQFGGLRPFGVSFLVAGCWADWFAAGKGKNSELTMSLRFHKHHPCTRQDGKPAVPWGYDVHHGFQLYHTDPSGNFSGWKAHGFDTSSAECRVFPPVILKQDCSYLPLETVGAANFRHDLLIVRQVRAVSGQAYAIGVNNNTAMQIMRQDWKPGGAQDGAKGGKSQTFCISPANPTSSWEIPTFLWAFHRAPPPKLSKSQIRLKSIVVDS